jgi:CRISPR system Cascade subunit CasD
MDREYLILHLQGVMQSWGGHTYEDYRPSMLFPTRSALVGLLAACLGIERNDCEKMKALSESFHYAVRADEMSYPIRKLTDFHTVREARKVDGSPNKNPVVSRREYLCDASFTVALHLSDNPAFAMEVLIRHLRKPVYTPFLGRRSCPMGVPLFHSTVEGVSLLDALGKVEPCRGTVYSEDAEGSINRYVVRDVPLCNGKRQFANRTVYIHAPGGSDAHQ